MSYFDTFLDIILYKSVIVKIHTREFACEISQSIGIHTPAIPPEKKVECLVIACAVSVAYLVPK